MTTILSKRSQLAWTTLYTILANPTYIVLDLEKNEKKFESLDPETNKKKIVYEEATYESFFDRCYELHEKLSNPSKITTFSHSYAKDYKRLADQIESFLIEITKELRNNEECANLLKLEYTKKGIEEAKRYKLPVLQTAIKQNMFRLVSEMRLQNMLHYLVYKDIPWLVTFPSFFYAFAVIIIGFFHPFYSIASSLCPDSCIGRFARVPPVLYGAELASEMVFFVIVAVYPLIEVDYQPQLIYHGVLTLLTITKLIRIYQEHYLRQIVGSWKNTKTLTMMFEAFYLSIVCFLKMKWLLRGYREQSGKIAIFEYTGCRI